MVEGVQQGPVLVGTFFNPYTDSVGVPDGVYLQDLKGTVCSVQPWARELPVMHRLGGVNSGLVPSRLRHIEVLCQR